MKATCHTSYNASSVSRFSRGKFPAISSESHWFYRHVPCPAAFFFCCLHRRLQNLDACSWFISGTLIKGLLFPMPLLMGDC
ncbi:hypothetical protein CFC21_071747 [Triticum aestivum]|uniref:Uncharacterized protein n=1 Tax=Triticum aestivum TaxID=4565 RepID=A0A9R1HIF7_WHEAT|nr:hypothetical protein CFC21_071747 [Triticum aestivum]